MFNSRLKIVFLSFGYSMIFTYGLVMMCTFLEGFIFGANTIIIHLNNIGEAIPEFFLIVVSIPFVFYAIWHTVFVYLKRIHKEVFT